MIERAFGNIGLIGDLLHGDGFQAVLVEQSDRGGNDLVLGFFFFSFDPAFRF